MIESINNAGSSGGGTDELAKVSSNDTTAGYLNGKLVAGSGITLTENNNGGDETLGIALGSHVHATTDITSGVMATARLGTGTANGTTFLAGDQTYKTPPYPVTSVNFATGDVSVNDDQIYSFTIQDAENTTALRNLVNVTIPGGSGAVPNGNIIWVEILYHTRNNSGSTANLSSGLVINGSSVTTSTNGVLSSATNFYGRVRQPFWFDNVSNVIRTVSPGQNAVETNWAGVTYAQNTLAYWNFDGYPAIMTPTGSFTIQFTAQWNVANANTFVRVLNARAYRQRGQAT